MTHGTSICSSLLFPDVRADVWQREEFRNRLALHTQGYRSRQLTCSSSNGGKTFPLLSFPSPRSLPPYSCLYSYSYPNSYNSNSNFHSHSHSLPILSFRASWRLISRRVQGENDSALQSGRDCCHDRGSPSNSDSRLAALGPKWCSKARVISGSTRRCSAPLKPLSLLPTEGVSLQPRLERSADKLAARHKQPAAGFKFNPSTCYLFSAFSFLSLAP